MVRHLTITGLVGAAVLGVAVLVNAQIGVGWLSIQNNAAVFSGPAARPAQDNTSDLGASALSWKTVYVFGLTAGSGTGITVNDTGSARQTVYKVTVTSANFVANATTADVTLATLPAKGIVSWMLADITQTFACASVCTSTTLSMTCGTSAGGNQYLASFDLDAAAAQFGDAQAELGSALKTATPPVTPLGDLPSWSATTTLQCRFTSGTGNVGNGSVTNLSQGSLTFYLATASMP